jgi:hypothetical protein
VLEPVQPGPGAAGGPPGHVLPVAAGGVGGAPGLGPHLPPPLPHPPRRHCSPHLRRTGRPQGHGMYTGQLSYTRMIIMQIPGV